MDLGREEKKNETKNNDMVNWSKPELGWDTPTELGNNKY